MAENDPTETGETLDLETSTADQLEQAPIDNTHGMPGPGKEFNGEQNLNFDAIAAPRHPPHGEPGHPGSPWSLGKNLD